MLYTRYNDVTTTPEIGITNKKTPDRPKNTINPATPCTASTWNRTMPMDPIVKDANRKTGRNPTITVTLSANVMIGWF